jgi:hypothetical protein
MHRYATLLSLTLASVAGAQQGAGHGSGHGAGHDAHKGATPAAAAARPAVTSVARPARYSGKVVTVKALDYAFEIADSVEAGYTTIRLLNQGKELHHVQMARLEEGHTLKDLFEAMKDPAAKPPKWFIEVGGPNAPVPGGESAASLELTAGRYVLLCFIPSPDGTPHIMKGMAKEFVVTAPKAQAAKAAKAATVKAPSTTVTLSDYDFAFSKPLVAGEQTIRLVNNAEQHHEMFIAKLAPGKTAMDLARWAEKAEGPPPGMPIGGITGIDKGRYNDLTLNLEPGEYALICFLPDAKDGKPHLAYGMIKQVTVAPRVANK